MADWRQIQARIRKAKNAPDAPVKLSELYERTRDAMVAWELGLLEEKAGRNEEAVTWYKNAVERFRRADWKKKAEEALPRLGVEGPPPGEEKLAGAGEETPLQEHSGEPREQEQLPLAVGEIPETEPAAEPAPALSHR